MATTYDLHDQLGTASRQTNSSASTTATRTYDAFGMLVASAGTPQGPFGFAATSGYQEDGDTGLKLLGHRYYDPSTGRFLTRDPARDGRNWYAYCDNNPVRSVDITGKNPILIVIAVAAVAVGLYGLWQLSKWADQHIKDGREAQRRRDQQIDDSGNPDNDGSGGGTGEHSGVGGSNPTPPTLGGPIQEPIRKLQKDVADKARDQYVYAPLEGVHDVVSLAHFLWDQASNLWLR